MRKLNTILNVFFILAVISIYSASYGSSHEFAGVTVIEVEGPVNQESSVFYSMQTLPVSYAGVLLILLSVVFFIAEVFTASYGILSIGGVIALAIGSLMLFEEISVSILFLLPALVIVGGGCCLIAFFGFKAQTGRPSMGTHILKDEIGVVRQKLDPDGIVFIRGEYWTAKSAGETLEQGTEVKVGEVKGLTLIVSKK